MNDKELVSRMQHGDMQASTSCTSATRTMHIALRA